MIALYENDTPFEPHIVNLMDAAESAALKKLWPIGKFPVLRDEARDRTIPESSIIIEYLAQHYPGRSKLVPADEDLARRTRLSDRFFDLYVNVQVRQDRDRQAAAGGKERSPRGRGGEGAAEDLPRHDRERIWREGGRGGKTWAMGEVFTMADCAAAPALFYANIVMPFAETHKNAAAYLGRLKARPSYARALKEAEPYLAMMPK